MNIIKGYYAKIYDPHGYELGRVPISFREQDGHYALKQRGHVVTQFCLLVKQDQEEDGFPEEEEE